MPFGDLFMAVSKSHADRHPLVERDDPDILASLRVSQESGWYQNETQLWLYPDYLVVDRYCRNVNSRAEDYEEIPLSDLEGVSIGQIPLSRCIKLRRRSEDTSGDRVVAGPGGRQYPGEYHSDEIPLEDDLVPKALGFVRRVNEVLRGQQPREGDAMGGSGIRIGDNNQIYVTGSNVSIDQSRTVIESRIERRIEEDGGPDAQEMRDILDEVRKLVDVMERERRVVDDPGLMERISRHLHRHGWFYGEIVGLIGQAVLMLVSGGTAG